jgi:nucleoside-diphosphate-sugar epimerase
MARVLVIGGTGVASAHCTTALIEDGHIVGTFRRGTARPTPIAPGSLTILGDRNDSAALGKAMTDFAPGIVIDFMCFTPAQADALLEVLAPSCRHLVFVSTVDVYGMPLPRLPMTETVPWSKSCLSPD